MSLQSKSFSLVLLSPAWLAAVLALANQLGAQESGVKVLRQEPIAQGKRVVLGIAEPESHPATAPNGQVYTQLRLKGSGADNEFGRPALPLVHFVGEVPSGMKVNVTVREENLREMKVAQPLWPHQKPVPKLPGALANREFLVDSAAYSGVKSLSFQKAATPDLQVTQFRRRGEDYVDIIARPFAYQAQAGVVRYPQELVLDFTYLAPDLPKAAGPRTGRIVLLEMTLRGPADLDWLKREGYNFERRGKDRVEVYATEAEAQALKAAGFEVKEIGEQPSAPKSSSQSSKGLGVYHTYTSLTTELQQYSAGHSNLCRLQSIGRSVLGREIWAMKITESPEQESAKPRVRLAGAMHGDEPLGGEMCLYFIDLLLNGSQTNARLSNLVATTEIWVVPFLNPDGLEAVTRFNAGGFDLNRSFPDGGGGGLGNPVFGPPPALAGRPPEVVAMMQFSLNRNFTLAANLHGGALVVNYPYDDDDLGAVDSPTPDDTLFEIISRTYSSNNPPMWASASFPQGIVNGADWYVAEGGMQDWHYRYVGCNEVTIEISDNKRPDASLLPQFWNENREAMLQFVETVHTRAEGRVIDQATGLPLQAAMKPLGIDHPVFGDPQTGDYHRMLLPGTYHLLFTAPGYEIRVVSNVVVQAGQPTRVDVALPAVVRSPERIILVTCESLRPSLAGLKARKEEDGFQVQEVVVANGTSNTRVRSAIRDVYSTFPSEYILLVGDVEHVPVFTDEHATDLPYALIDSGESFTNYLGKDAVLGRISLKTSAALAEYVQKNAAFARSRTNRLADLTWVSSGNNSSEYDQAERGHEYCITNCVPENFSNVRFFRDSGSAAELTGHINAGTDGVIYSGHGAETGWARYNYDLTELTGLNNVDHVPIVLGHCCVAGSFNIGVCFAEGWLQTTARGVTYVGATDNTYWDEDEWMQMAEFDAMKSALGVSIGRAVEAGLLSVHQNNPGMAEYYYTAYHNLGDPTLVLFDPIPVPLAIRTAPVLDPACTGAPYSTALRAVGGIPPYLWMLTGGQLPNGLGLNAASGVISGIATQAGSYSFTIEVEDSSPTTQVASATFTLAVRDLSDMLNEAVDVPDWVWASGGSAFWMQRSSVTHDGVDAAECGGISHGQQGWMETTVTGPGIISFWWKVSSQTNSDVLQFLVNGMAQPGAISGEVDWQFKAFLIESGPQTLRWVYAKDGSVNLGQDRAWVDQVEFTSSLAPVILASPQDAAAVTGDNILLSVEAVGGAPLSYEWLFNGLAVAGATNTTLFLADLQLSQGGDYQAVVSNPSGSVTSAVATLTVVQGISLAAALDITGFVIQTGGAAGWTGQAAASCDGVDAARSGAISHSQETWMETTVQGPGVLSFWWRVSSESGYDYLGFYTNGALAGSRISGTVNCALRTVPLGDGPHTLRWVYSKDGSVNTGEDCGWVDQVQFTTSLAPLILAQPESQTVIAGDSASLVVSDIGAQPMSYQWFHDDLALPWGTNASLSLINVQTSDAGGYYVLLSNAHGNATSTVATVTVVTGLSLAQAVDAPALVFNSGGNGLWSAQTAVTHDGVDAAASGSIAHSQESWLETTVTGPGRLTFWWKVSSESGFDYLRFYTNGMLLAGSISGEQDWSQQSLDLPSGSVALRWRYVKDGSVVSGQDKGWLDQVSFVSFDSPPTIVQQPQGRSVPLGASTTFTVAADGTPPLHYQWRKDAADLPDATNAFLALPSVQLADEGSYDVVVTNTFGSETSQAAVLTVAVAPVITLQPVSLTAPAGGSASFHVEASGTPPMNFRWRRNGSTFTSALIVNTLTGSTLTITNVLPLYDNSRFSVVVSNVAGMAPVSSNAILTVFGPPVIVFQPTNQTLNPGDSATFMANATGVAPLRYQWLFNDAALEGRTSQVLTLTDIQAAQEGYYSVVVTNRDGAAISQRALLTVLRRPALVEPAVLADGSFCLMLEGNRDRTYAVEISTNLVDWSSLASTNCMDGRVMFIDPEANRHGQRFYRALLVP